MCLLSFIFNYRDYEENDNQDEAVKTYEKILRINPDHIQAKNAIDRIKGFEKDAKEFGIDFKFDFLTFFCVMSQLFLSTS